MDSNSAEKEVRVDIFCTSSILLLINFNGLLSTQCFQRERMTKKIKPGHQTETDLSLCKIWVMMRQCFNDLNSGSSTTLCRTGSSNLLFFWLQGIGKEILIYCVIFYHGTISPGQFHPTQVPIGQLCEKNLHQAIAIDLGHLPHWQFPPNNSHIGQFQVFGEDYHLKGNCDRGNNLSQISQV